MQIKKIGYDSESSNGNSSESESEYTYETETITDQDGGKKWLTFGESGYRRPKKQNKMNLQRKKF